MRRINPDTGKPYKCGDISEDGLKIFRSLSGKTKTDRDGYFYEIWEDSETFLRRKQERREIKRKRDLTAIGKAEQIIKNSKRNAKKRGHDHTLTTQDLLPALEKGVCELTGLPFNFEPAQNKKHMNLYAASADRLDNSKGYHKDNVRIVLWAVNRAVGEDEDEEMLPILEAMVKAIKENVKQKSIAPVPTRPDQESEHDAKRRALLTARLGEDRDDAHHHCGADAGKDADHRTQASSGDSLGRRSEEVESFSAFTRIKDHGDAEPEIVRLDFGRGHLPD